jgi:acyl CoA:acetate/3-ketoacid CoA transferase beta subunit/acyl CoA:acetate/3-ketoacid CoA transferase alpha subunit
VPIVPLDEAVRELVHDGNAVALEGFTHLIPHAAGHELIRQGKRDLTLVRMTPDVICDQLIGMGCARKLVFSWGGNPGVGSLHRLRDAVERGWPAPLVQEEHSHAGMAAAYAAGAAALPFGVLRGYRGTDLPARTRVKTIACPFTGEELAAVPAHRPDVGIVHAQQADRQGNVQLWGITGIQKEAVLASARAIVTVEEVVDELELRPGGLILPSWVIDAVSLAPGGAHPSYAHGYYDRDNDFYVAWDEISRDRDRFCAWMGRHVLGTANVAEYRASLAEGGDIRISRDGDRPRAADEMMAVEGARRLHDGTVCFVGIGLPSRAANLARTTHAPRCVLIYESGTIGAKPEHLPLSIGDGELAETADAVVSVPEIFSYWLQGGRVDVGFLGAAQIDRHGNLNSTVIGDYASPKVRLPGAGGAPEIALGARDVFVMLRHTHRAFVEKLDFTTCPGDRVRVVITDLGVLEPRDGELTLTHVHPGVEPEQVREATGWELRIADDLSVSDPPTDRELTALRTLETASTEPIAR